MHHVSEYKRTVASFPSLTSSSPGSLSRLSAVNWKEPTQRRSVPISLFLPVLYQLLSEYLCSYRARSHSAVSQWQLRALLATFWARCKSERGQSKFTSVWCCTRANPCASRVWLAWGCSGCTMWASCRSILIQPPLPLFMQQAWQWSLEAKNMSSWRATGSSSSVTSCLFGMTWPVEPCLWLIQRTPK